MRFGKLGIGFGGLGSQGGPGNSIIPGLITAGAGSYVWSGDTMVPLVDYIIPAGAGSYAFSGSAASFLRSRLITASGGSYAYTGQDATLTVAAGASTTTWNSADKDSSITLTGGDLIATKGGTDAFRSLRAIASHSSGKYYWEITINTIVTNTGVQVGVANSSMALTSYVSDTTNGVAWSDHTTGVRLNDTTPSNGSTGTETYAAGDIVCLALDLDNLKLWVRKNNNNWMGSGTADPATNTLGASLSTLAAGPYYPAATLFDNGGDQITANFGGSAFTYTAPSGFGNW